MKKTIFDSNSEKIYYKRLFTRWNNYVNIYPQIPVRNVIGYNKLKKLCISDKAKKYLQETSFDYVVCDKEYVPILVIEFDGIGGGFSKNGEYIPNFIPTDAPYRKLKLETKLKVCNLNSTPMVVVSFKECDFLKESQDLLSVIDVLIGEAIERNHYKNNYSKYNKCLSEAIEKGSDALEAVEMEIDMMLDFANPVKRKIYKITKKFPFWVEQIIIPYENKDYISGTFRLISGLKLTPGKKQEKRLVSVNISIRNVGFWDNMISVFNTIGEYCLAKKTYEELGTDQEKWRKRFDDAIWVDL
ncbi:MAG: DUF2726 domain-containing protein [Candidatus Woesearchaeota archaeon]